jgi:glutamate-1-semialdehyde 2,1-aminomutase
MEPGSKQPIQSFLEKCPDAPREVIRKEDMPRLGIRAQQEYTANHPLSAALYERALRVFPSGVTHDARFLRPFPIYVSRSQGAKKWDVDGREYIDYWMGHGALILGHNYPDVVESLHRQIDRGAHYGACHELEVEWGERIVALIPSAERVRFTASGTEATLMALRLARTYTGKKKIVRFEGHYHGWHDAVSIGTFPPFNIPDSSGIPESFLSSTVVLPPDDLQPLEDLLERDSDVACVILEPSGGFSGAHPLNGEDLRSIREMTEKRGVPLIFDEVITGFRFSPGGAQALYGIMPDLSCFAKVLAGGLPGGAVAGRKDIMTYLEFKEDAEWNRRKKILHPGTFNANPISAASGVATLSIISQGEVIPRANQYAQNIRDILNRVIDSHGINWCAHGEHSVVHLLMNHACTRREKCDRRLCRYDYRRIYQKDPVLLSSFRIAMLNQGVDSIGDLWWISWLHSEDIADKTGYAFDKSIGMLKQAFPERFPRR